MSRKKPAAVLGTPPPPRLKNEARRKWLEVFSTFTPRSPLDTELACQFCEAWADYIAARKIVEKEGIVAPGGNGAPYQHPALSTQNKCQERMVTLHKILAPMLGDAATDKDEFGL